MPSAERMPPFGGSRARTNILLEDITAVRFLATRTAKKDFSVNFETLWDSSAIAVFHNWIKVSTARASRDGYGGGAS